MKIDRKFLIAHPDEKVRNYLVEQLTRLQGTAKLFAQAQDSRETVFKIQNAPPHLVILAADLGVRTGQMVAEWLVSDQRFDQVAVILLSEPNETGTLIDHVISKRIQFLANLDDTESFDKCVARALDYSHHGDKEEFFMRFFAAGDVLMKQGEKGETCFLVLKGRLKAVRKNDGAETILGHIERGEFVGEMAFINGEARIADVVAAETTEAIEIPYDRLDQVLFRKPVWARALMKSLSRRLKIATIE